MVACTSPGAGGPSASATIAPPVDGPSGTTIAPRTGQSTRSQGRSALLSTLDRPAVVALSAADGDLVAVVVAGAVEGEDLPGRGDGEAGRAGQRPQVPDRLAGRGGVQPGAQRLGGEPRDVQHLVGGPLGGGRDAPPGAQPSYREHGADQGGQQHENRYGRRQVATHAGIVSYL